MNVESTSWRFFDNSSFSQNEDCRVSMSQTWISQYYPMLNSRNPNMPESLVHSFVGLSMLTCWPMFVWKKNHPPCSNTLQTRRVGSPGWCDSPCCTRNWVQSPRWGELSSDLVQQQDMGPWSISNQNWGIWVTPTGWWLGHPSEKYESQLGWL